MFEFDLGIALSVTCTKCGAVAELPDSGGGRLPAASPDGSTTLEADKVCRCGGTRVRVRLDFGDSEEEAAAVEAAEQTSDR